MCIDEPVRKLIRDIFELQFFAEAPPFFTLAVWSSVSLSSMLRSRLANSLSLSDSLSVASLSADSASLTAASLLRLSHDCCSAWSSVGVLQFDRQGYGTKAHAHAHACDRTTTGNHTRFCNSISISHLLFQLSGLSIQVILSHCNRLKCCLYFSPLLLGRC